MHGKRDQNGSVNVLGPAALTLAVPLRFTMHVCPCVCVFVCVWQEVCACKDVLHPFFGFLGGFFWCDRFQSQITLLR